MSAKVRDWNPAYPCPVNNQSFGAGSPETPPTPLPPPPDSLIMWVSYVRGADSCGSKLCMLQDVPVVGTGVGGGFCRSQKFNFFNLKTFLNSWSSIKDILFFPNFEIHKITQLLPPSQPRLGSRMLITTIRLPPLKTPDGNSGCKPSFIFLFSRSHLQSPSPLTKS